MILQKVKCGDIENRKLDFRGWFYKLVVKVGYFFRKIIKRSPEFTILVKKYEIGDFGGSFDIFSALFIAYIRWNGWEWLRIYSKKCRKFIKRSPKTAKWVFARQKTRNGLFGDLLIIYWAFFRYFLGFLIHSIVFIRELTSIYRSMYDVKMINKTRNNEKSE